MYANSDFHYNNKISYNIIRPFGMGSLTVWMREILCTVACYSIISQGMKNAFVTKWPPIPSNAM